MLLLLGSSCGDGWVEVPTRSHRGEGWISPAGAAGDELSDDPDPTAAGDDACAAPSWEEVCDFDVDAQGASLPANAELAAQYAAIGVTFAGGFRVAARATAFPCYQTATGANLVCTTAGAGATGCTPPALSVMTVELMPPVDLVAVTLRTGCGIDDGDGGSLTAFDSAGALLGADSVTARTDPTTRAEGAVTARVRHRGISRVVIDPGDFDSIDDLVLARFPADCAMP
jgi:hypothetical protein